MFSLNTLYLSPVGITITIFLRSAAVPVLTSPCFQFITQLLQGVFSDEQPRMKSVGHHQESVGWSDAGLVEFSSPFAVGRLAFACQARSYSSAEQSVLETPTRSTVLGHVPFLSFHPVFIWGCVVVKNSCLSYCGSHLESQKDMDAVSYSHTSFGWWLLFILQDTPEPGWIMPSSWCVWHSVTKSSHWIRYFIPVAWKWNFLQGFAALWWTLGHWGSPYTCAVRVQMFSCLLCHQVQTLITRRLILNLTSGVWRSF